MQQLAGCTAAMNETQRHQVTCNSETSVHTVHCAVVTLLRYSAWHVSSCFLKTRIFLLEIKFRLRYLPWRQRVLLQLIAAQSGTSSVSFDNAALVAMVT